MQLLKMGLNYGKAILVFYIIPTIYLIMKTNRFETFMDAILAIIITVLVLKLSQPAAPTMSAVLNLNIGYLTYFICFVVIFNTWHNDHNLFQMVDEIDNSIVFVYAVLLFVLKKVWTDIDPDIQTKAKEKLYKWFDEDEIDEEISDLFKQE